jgi:hypothetical protein
MGSLSNIEVLKLLALLNVPDQGSYYKNMSALKEATLSLPLPVKNEGRSTPAPSSRLSPSSRNMRSSRAPSLAPTEDSGYFSGIRGSVASTPRRSARSRSQTPALRQQYASPPSRSPKSPSTPRFVVNIPKSPSVAARSDTPSASPSQAQETGPSMDSAAGIPPGDESPMSDGRVPPATKTPAEAVSEENLGMMKKMKDKGKGKEVVWHDELSVVHEVGLEEDLYGDLRDIVPWPPLTGRPSPGIGPSHSKSTEPPSRDLETHPITRPNAESFSSSAATTVSITNVGHIPTDATGPTKVRKKYIPYIPREWKGDPQDLDSGKSIVGVCQRDFDSDDDMDGIKAARLWDRGHLGITEERMEWCRSVFASLAKKKKLEKEREIYLKREERTYHSEVLIDY